MWSEQTERYSPPLKITQICEDGTIYLVTSDEERPTPWEEGIKNIDALPIDADLLRGFGFELRDKNVIAYGFREYIFYGNIYVGHLYSFLNGEIMCNSLSMDFKYMNEMCSIMCKYCPNVKLEWKGIER